MTREHSAISLIPRTAFMLTRALLLVVLTTLAAPAEAQICQPGRVVKINVGDTASDAACHYNDIQSALNAVGNCPTQINVTRMHIWNNQHLTTGGKNVTLQGWGDGVTCFTLSQTCGPEVCPIPTSTQPLVIINGNDTPGRVLTISGANSFVTLRHLFIMRGSVPSGDGAGIGFAGTGALNLDTTTVSLNNAEYGGGINFKGTGSSPTQAVLRLRKETLILNNTAAVSGGGIRMEGLSQLFVEEPKTWIAFNSALTGFGGGIELLDGAQAFIGSSGYNGVAVVSNNEAQDGGGIAALVSDEGFFDTEVYLYSVDPQQPVGISGNSAAARGGAFYLRPNRDEFPGNLINVATVRAYGARIEDNTAPDGAIAYLDHDVGGLGSPVGSHFFIYDTPSPRGGHGCPSAPPCTRMNGNATRTLNGSPVANGALIAMGPASDIFMNRVEFRNNEGGLLIRMQAPENKDFATFATLWNCLIADNALANGVLRAPSEEGWRSTLSGCTVVGNTIASGPVVFGRDDSLTLEYSIFDQPGVPTLDYNLGAIANLTTQYLLSNDVSTLPVALDIIQGVPSYANGQNGNYRLRHNSLGIDFAPADAAPGFDLDGQPRVTDQPLIPNHFGPRDLGAYERSDPPPPEVIEADGFEDHISS